MFVDRVRLQVCAGNGGRGIVAWRREKCVSKGGPAGGDGGSGGSVLVVVDPNVCGLDYFRHLTKIEAKSGEKGAGKGCKGANGPDTILHVPPGTLVRDCETDEILFDGVVYHDTYVLCHGGKGGLGNVHFKTPSNRAPNIATPGEEGEHCFVEFELKLIGDVGLVGFPNAGKSTLLSNLTYTQVEIAAYPFTTLSPNLGYISYEGGRRVLLTDIPGIIEGAHQNRGLGFEFLRHIERTKVLLFVLDAAGIDGRDPLSDYRILVDELKRYDAALLKRPSCIVLNKCDLEEARDNIQIFLQNVSHPYILQVSAQSGENLPALKQAIEQILPEEDLMIHNFEKSNKEEKLAYIRGVIEKYVVPQLSLDGGGVEVLDLVGDTILISYTGACACCPMALSGTLSMIQGTISQHIDAKLTVKPSFSFC